MIDDIRFHYRSGPIITYYKDAKKCEIHIPQLKKYGIVLQGGE